MATARSGYPSPFRSPIATPSGRYPTAYSVAAPTVPVPVPRRTETPFVEKLRAGCDLVMGNRFQGGIEPGAMPPLHRYLGNPVLTFVGRLFFKSPSGDFHCGLRGFRKEAALRMNLQGIFLDEGKRILSTI